MDEDHPFETGSAIERPTAISRQLSDTSLENAAVRRDEDSDDSPEADVGIRSAESLEEVRATINAELGLSGVAIDLLRTSVYSASTIQPPSEGSEASSWQTECCICMEEYKEGDHITSLPCNHFFHSGACPRRTASRPEHPHELTWKSLGGGRRPDCNVCNTFIPRGQHGWSCEPCDWTACSRCIAAPADVPCGGLRTWLKRDRRCPLCRVEVRLRSQPERAPSGNPWECPGCQVLYADTHATCDTCGIRKVIFSVVQGMAAGAIRKIEEVLLRILQFRNRVLQLERPKPAATMSADQLKAELLRMGYSSFQLLPLNHNDRVHAVTVWQSLETATEEEVRETLRRLDGPRFQANMHLDKSGLIAQIQEVRAQQQATRKQELSQRITLLSRSREMTRLTNANWMIADAVEHMLTRLLEGDMEISFVPGSMTIMDVNSRALYMLVVDIVQATKVTILCQSEDFLHRDELLRITIERPTMAAVHAAIEQNRQQSRYQSCPFCATSLVQHTRAATRRQPCGCGTGFDLQHILLANGIANEVFLEAEEIFQAIIAFDQSMELSHERTAHVSVPVPETLVESIRAFVTSPKMADLDEKGWRLQSLFAKVFTALLQRTSRTITFPVGYVDPNSTRLFAVIWRKWKQQLEEARSAMSADTAALWTLQLNEPSIRTSGSRNGSSRDLTTEELANRYFTTEEMLQQRSPGDERAHRLLQNNSRTMCQIARLILKQDGNREAVDRTLRALLQRLQSARWDITASVLLMRRGVRELPFLVPDDLDSNSAAVVEALLRVVISIERGDGGQTGEGTDDNRLDFEAFVRHHIRRNVGGTVPSRARDATVLTEAMPPFAPVLGVNSTLGGTINSERRQIPGYGRMAASLPPPPMMSTMLGSTNPLELIRVGTTVQALRTALQSSSGLPSILANDCIILLVRILTNILDSDDMRYRRLSLAHGVVATFIALIPEAVAILQLAGFQRDDGDILTMASINKPLLMAIIVEVTKILRGPADDETRIYGP